MNVRVIRADLKTPAHARALIDLLEDYALDPMGGAQPLSAYSKTHLATALQQRDDAHVVIAFVQEKPVGLIVCLEGFSTFACKPLLNIHDVVVRAAYRGQGIASVMFEQIEILAREKGCCKLTLEVLQGNQVAQAAYKRFGFGAYELDPQLGQALFWEKKLD